MNQAGPTASPPVSTYPVVRTTRSSPSAPTPRCRSQRATTMSAVRSTSPPGSGTITKSFPVPWPLANGRRSIVPSSAIAGDDGERPAGQVGRGAIQPDRALVAAEPGPLLADEAAGGPDRLLP